MNKFYGDAEYKFELPTNLVLELERQTSRGIGALVKTVVDRDFNLRDLQETIRLALIGGGLDPQKATEHVAAQFNAMPIEANLIIAVEILEKLYFGNENDAAS